MPTIWDNREKTGTFIGGWQYNEINLTYDQLLDPDTNESVYYNGIGMAQVWINQTKN